MLMKPPEFKCKKKGNSEQLLQDFIAYKKKMERFFDGSKAVKVHTGDQADTRYMHKQGCNFGI